MLSCISYISAVELTRHRTSVDNDQSHWLAPACAVSIVLLGAALQINDGMLDPAAIGYLSLALILLLAAVVTRRPARLGAFDSRIVPLFCGAGLVIQIAELMGAPPGNAVRFDATSQALFTCGVAGLGLLGAAMIGAPGMRRRWLLVATLLAVHFALGVLVIRHAQSLFIDVDVFQRESIAALRNGINPYAITFPNIYRSDTFYGPGASLNGRLQFGFPYFPLTLLLALPGELLAGDHRYGALVAIEAAAALMVYARRGGFGSLAAVLDLTTPRLFFVLEQSWTDPFNVLGLAAVVFAACRYRRIVPWLFGAFMALKQYLVVVLPAAVLLVREKDARSLTRLLGIGALTGAVVTVPFVLWDPHAFVTSVVTLQFRQPFRGESLSYLAWWASNGHAQPSAVIAFIVAAILSAVTAWRLPHTATGFATALAVTLFGFFVFNKQAFCNYYFFVVGALAIALAATDLAPDREVRGPAPDRSGATGAGLMPRSTNEWLALGALVAVSLVPLIWPGDVPFINDEPQLIAAAAQANAAGHLAEHGLLGTFGFVYGPFPTWVYQALIAVSTNLVVVAAMHTILIVGATAFALWWLSRSLGLWVWFAPVPLCSPYFWFYARALWDNPFLIPLGSLAIAGYAAHLRSGSQSGLRVAVLAMAAIPLVHLMGIVFVVPLGVHMVVLRWRALWAQRTSTTVIVAGMSMVAWPYLRYLLASHGGGFSGTSGWIGYAFPLLGGRLLSARELQYFYGQPPVQGATFHAAASISWLGYALVWVGMAVAGHAVVVAARVRRWTPRTHIGVILLAAIVCQMALDGLTGKYEHPQYYNGTWIAFALFAWYAVDWAAARRSVFRLGAPAITIVLASALLVAVGTVASRLHSLHGTREIYGPTLANQQRIARELARYSPASPLSIGVFPYTLYPQGLEILRQLNPPRYQSNRYAELEIRYSSRNPASGAIQLVPR
jgi:hypothetical protein